VQPVDEGALLSPDDTPAEPPQPVRWFRRTRLFALVLLAGIALLAVGGAALLQVGSVDSDTEAFGADADADAVRLAELNADIDATQQRLDELGLASSAAQEQQAELTAQIEELQETAEEVAGQIEAAEASLLAASSGAVALYGSIDGLVEELNATVAAEATVGRSLLEAVEAGNRRQLDAMSDRLEDGDGIDEMRATLAREAAALTSLKVRLFEAGGMTADGILATESFDEPESGWTVIDSADGTAGYVDGRYQIVAQTRDTAVIGFMATSIADIGIEVDAEMVQAPGDGDYEYGITCRAREATTTQGYLLSVGATHVRIGAFDSAGAYQELTPWRDLLDASSPTRHLAAICQGDRIALLVDGELVAETTAIGLDGASIGLFAVSYGADPITVRFDDLRLVHPSLLGGGDAS